MREGCTLATLELYEKSESNYSYYYEGAAANRTHAK